MRRWRADVVVLLLLSLATALGQHSKKQKPDALVEMVPGVDEKVFGKLALYKKQHGVFIEGIIHNLKPGLHGFHVHDEGLLGNKCMDAGPHFNPTKKVHAGPKDLHRHAGDLGNVLADKNGVAKISIFDGHISLHPRDKTFIGKRSFVIHAKPDDLGRGGDDESLRTGNAGGRLSCGIVIVLGHSLKEPPPVYKAKKHGGGSGGGGGGKSNRGFGGGGSHSHHKHHHNDDDYFSGGFDDNDFGFGGSDHHGGGGGGGHGQASNKFPNHHGGGGFHSSGSNQHQQKHPRFGNFGGRSRNHFGYDFGQRLHGYGSSNAVHRLPAPMHPQPYRGSHVTQLHPVAFGPLAAGYSQPLLAIW